MRCAFDAAPRDKTGRNNCAPHRCIIPASANEPLQSLLLVTSRPWVPLRRLRRFHGYSRFSPDLHPFIWRLGWQLWPHGKYCDYCLRTYFNSSYSHHHLHQPEAQLASLSYLSTHPRLSSLHLFPRGTIIIFVGSVDCWVRNAE